MSRARRAIGVHAFAISARTRRVGSSPTSCCTGRRSNDGHAERSEGSRLMTTTVLRHWAGFAILSGALASAPAAAQGAPRIPLAKGLAIAHTEQGVGGERESVTAVEDATSAGVRYGWSYREITTNGDT